MNIDYKLLKEQRDHLLSILWHDFKPPHEKESDPVPLDRELGWGIVNLLDGLLDEDYYRKNPKKILRTTIINIDNLDEGK
tara:strand:+ start:5220 stop:5459 length:240 start_codon:yes stop_codon:yes gene_type:complete